MADRYLTFRADAVANAAQEMAATFHHAGFVMRRELGEPVADEPIVPAVWRERRRAASRGAMPDLDADQMRLALYALGLAGEAGEVADEAKKALFHHKPLDPEKMLVEVGDVLWYADHLLALLGYTLADALEANDAKLSARYPDGWAAAYKHYDHDDHEARP